MEILRHYIQNGPVLSGLLHLVVFLVLVFGLPSFSSPPDYAPPIPVELVVFNEDEILPEPEPEPEPEKQDEPVPEPPQQEAKAVPTVEPPAPEPIPEPEVEPLPAELAPEPEPEPEAIEAAEPEVPKPTRKPKVQLANLPKPKVEEPKKKEQPKDALASVLKNVEKLRQQAAKTQTNPEPTQTASSTHASPLEEAAMVRAIKQQMSGCWRIEAGALDAENLIVEIHVALKPDGSVRSADILDSNRMLTDRYFRSAAENARRAVLQCSPFELPPRQYDVWRDLTMQFDPRRMFGGG